MRESIEIWLSQHHYIKPVLKRFGMSACKAVSTPMSEGALKDINEADSPGTGQETCQELLGCLLFLSTRTYPDITTSVGILCHHTASPKQVHGAALKIILPYLSGTEEHAFLISCSEKPILRAFCDSYWAGDCADRKSTTGELLQLGGATVA